MGLVPFGHFFARAEALKCLNQYTGVLIVIAQLIDEQLYLQLMYLQL